MAKLRIALLPGDGIGRDVMDAAKIVLEKIDLDAEYLEARSAGSYGRTRGTPSPSGP
jgi:isocitrate/isopropylmalate dehydrogenase